MAAWIMSIVTARPPAAGRARAKASDVTAVGLNGSAGAAADRGEVTEDSTLGGICHGPFKACGGSKCAGGPGIRLSTGATPWPHRVVDIGKENTIKTNGKRTTELTRIVVRKRYRDYDKQDLAILANARRWLNRNGLERRYLTDEERQCRVQEYARQVAENGLIVAWMPPPDACGLRRRQMPVRHPQWRGFAY